MTEWSWVRFLTIADFFKYFLESVDQDMSIIDRTPNPTSIYTSPSVIQERKREAEQIERSQNSQNTGKPGNMGEAKKEKIWRIVDQIK